MKYSHESRGVTERLELPSSKFHKKYFKLRPDINILTRKLRGTAHT